MKLGIEKYLLLFQHLYDLKSTALRVANPFGERKRVDNAQGADGVLLSKAIRNQPIEIGGNNHDTQNYVYISDVAEALAQI